MNNRNKCIVYYTDYMYVMSCIICILFIIVFIIIFTTNDYTRCDSPMLQGYVRNIENSSSYNNTLYNNTLYNNNNTLYISVEYNISLQNSIYTIKCILENYTYSYQDNIIQDTMKYSNIIKNNSIIDIYIKDNLHICYPFYRTCSDYNILPVFIIIFALISSLFTTTIIILSIIVCIYKYIDN